MKTTIDAAGRLVIPKELRERAGFHAGTPLEISFHDGRIEIEPAAEASNIRLIQEGRFLVAVPLEPGEPLTVNDVNEVIESIRNERVGN